MKVVVLVLTLIVCAVTEEVALKNLAEWNNIIAECIRVNKIDMESWRGQDPAEYPNEEPVRKFILCVDKKLGFYSETGFNSDVFIRHYVRITEDEEELKRWSKTCVAELSDSHLAEDVYAYKMRTCLNRLWRGRSNINSRFF